MQKTKTLEIALNTGKANQGRKRMHRISNENASVAEEVFRNATLLMPPSEMKQRKVFEQLMPYMFVLRSQGHTWEDLTRLLKDCGLKLQESTVRKYFGELAKKNLEYYRRTTNSIVAKIDAAKQQAQGIPISSIAIRVSGI